MDDFTPLMEALAKKCQGTEAADVQVDVKVLNHAVDGLKKLKELQDMMVMKPSVAFKLNNEIRRLEEENKQLREQQKVRELEKKVKKLTEDLKASYNQKNFTLREQLRQLEKSYAPLAVGIPDMEDLMEDIVRLIDEHKDKAAEEVAGSEAGAKTPAGDSSRTFATMRRATARRAALAAGAAAAQGLISRRTGDSSSGVLEETLGPVAATAQKLHEWQVKEGIAGALESSPSERSQATAGGATLARTASSVGGTGEAASTRPSVAGFLDQGAGHPSSSGTTGDIALEPSHLGLQVAENLKNLTAMFTAAGGPLFPAQSTSAAKTSRSGAVSAPEVVQQKAQADIEELQGNVHQLMELWSQLAAVNASVPMPASGYHANAPRPDGATGPVDPSKLDAHAEQVLASIQKFKEQYGAAGLDVAVEQQMESLAANVKNMRSHFAGGGGPVFPGKPSAFVALSAHQNVVGVDAVSSNAIDSNTMGPRTSDMVAYFMSFLQSTGYMSRITGQKRSHAQASGDMAVSGNENHDEGASFPSMAELHAQFQSFMLENTVTGVPSGLVGLTAGSLFGVPKSPKPSKQQKTVNEDGTARTSVDVDTTVTTPAGTDSGAAGGVARTAPSTSATTPVVDLPSWMPILPALRITSAAEKAGGKAVKTSTLLDSAVPETAPSWWVDALQAAAEKGDEAVLPSGPTTPIATTTEAATLAADVQQPAEGATTAAAATTETQQKTPTAQAATADAAAVRSPQLTAPAGQTTASQAGVAGDATARGVSIGGAAGLSSVTSGSFSVRGFATGSNATGSAPFNPLILPGPARTMQAVMAHVRAKHATMLRDHPEAETLLSEALAAAAELQAAQDRSLLRRAMTMRRSRRGTPSACVTPGRLSPAASINVNLNSPRLHGTPAVAEDTEGEQTVTGVGADTAADDASQHRRTQLSFSGQESLPVVSALETEPSVSLTPSRPDMNSQPSLSESFRFHAGASNNEAGTPAVDVIASQASVDTQAPAPVDPFLHSQQQSAEDAQQGADAQEQQQQSMTEVVSGVISEPATPLSVPVGTTGLNEAALQELEMQQDVDRMTVASMGLRSGRFSAVQAPTEEDMTAELEEMREIASQNAEHVAQLQELLIRISNQHREAVERADDLDQQLERATAEATYLRVEVERITSMLIQERLAHAERADDSERMSERLRRSLQDERAARDEVERLKMQLAKLLQQQAEFDAEYEAALHQVLEEAEYAGEEEEEYERIMAMQAAAAAENDNHDASSVDGNTSLASQPSLRRGDSVRRTLTKTTSGRYAALPALIASGAIAPERVLQRLSSTGVARGSSQDGSLKSSRSHNADLPTVGEESDGPGLRSDRSN